MGLERWLVVVGALALPARARGETVSVTDLQVLYGGPFDDPSFGNDTANKQMFTLTFEHFGTWGYGDNYTLFDLTFGDFVDAQGKPTGQHARFFGKWAPRLSIGKILGEKDGFLGFLSDVLVAGQLHVGIDGFYAYMVGAGVDFDLPSPYVLSVDAYCRKDAFNTVTYQLTTFWEVPFDLWDLTFRFRGYVDIFGTDTAAADANGQPQLLLDVGSLMGVPRNKLQVGTEIYVHINDQVFTVAPQAMARWIW